MALQKTEENKTSWDVFTNMQSFIKAGDTGIKLGNELLGLFSESSDVPFVYSFDNIKLLAPIMRPVKNIICVGRNYREHVAESKQLSGTAQPIPDYPLFFTKPYTSVIGPNESIIFDQSITRKV